MGGVEVVTLEKRLQKESFSRGDRRVRFEKISEVEVVTLRKKLQPESISKGDEVINTVTQSVFRSEAEIQSVFNEKHLFTFTRGI